MDRRALREGASQISDRLSDLLGQLQKEIDERDGVAIYAQLHVLDAIQRSTVSGPESFGSDAAIEFFGSLVLATSPSVVESHLEAPVPAATLFDIHTKLREISNLELLQYVGRSSDPGNTEPIRLARHMMGFEFLFDRGRGYEPHVSAIFRRVTEPVDSVARRRLGYPLSAALDFAKAYTEVGADRYADAVDAAEVDPRRAANQSPEEFREELGSIASAGSSPLESDIAGAVHPLPTVTDLDELRRLATALSSNLGSNSSITSLRDPTSLRSRPIIATTDGRRLWARSADFHDIGLDWAFETCKGNPETLRAFDSSRQKVAEDLVYETAAAIFGEDRTWKSIRYDAPGRPDIDTLTVLPGGAALVFEVKGVRLTAPGREGRSDRTEKKISEFVTKPLDQNRRAIEYLIATARFSDKKNRQIHLPFIARPISIVAILERADPYYSHLTPLSSSAPDGSLTWIVSITDLRLIGETLPDSASFYAYADLRARMTQAGGPFVLEEAAALELWCTDRISVRASTDEISIIKQSPASLNNYYSAISVGLTPRPEDRVDPGVPEEVTDELDRLYAANFDKWADLATAVYNIAPTTWPRIRRLVETSSTSPARLSRATRKRIDAGRRGLQLSPDLSVTITNGEVSLTLHQTDSD